jgi:Na+-driven multidrug efflux pump
LAFALAHTLTCFGGFWGIPAALLVLRAQGQWGAGHEQAARRTLRRSQALSLLGVAIMALAVAVAVTVAIVQVVVGRGRVVPVSY